MQYVPQTFSLAALRVPDTMSMRDVYQSLGVVYSMTEDCRARSTNDLSVDPNGRNYPNADLSNIMDCEIYSGLFPVSSKFAGIDRRKTGDCVVAFFDMLLDAEGPFTAEASTNVNMQKFGRHISIWRTCLQPHGDFEYHGDASVREVISYLGGVYSFWVHDSIVPVRYNSANEVEIGMNLPSVLYALYPPV